VAGISTGAGAWLDRLPHGRHGLSRAEVLASQRGRILDALAKVTAARGYADTTVADVITQAGVSRRTFYEHFADKEACFLACFDTGIGYLLSELARSTRGVEDWRERLRAGVRTLLEVLASDPAFTRLGTVDVLAAGPEAIERRTEMMRVFARQYRRLHVEARRTEPGLPELDRRVFAALAGGVIETIVVEVLAGRTRKLPQLEPILMAFLLAGLTGSPG